MRMSKIVRYQSPSWNLCDIIMQSVVSRASVRREGKKKMAH